jgi:hypothetical protein
MDGFLPASSVTRRLSDIYSPIFSPVTFLSRCESLRSHDRRTLASRFGEGTLVRTGNFLGAILVVIPLGAQAPIALFVSVTIVL